MRYITVVFWGLVVGSPGLLHAETIFVEAEDFQCSSPGWTASSNEARASRAKTLWGAEGPVDAVATKNVKLREPGSYRLWVRYLQVGAWRGPFRLAVSATGKELAAKVFDLEADASVDDWNYAWQSVEVELPAGEFTLSLAKHEAKNCVGYVRHVDCILLTNNADLAPDYLPYGPQVFMRVTLGEGYDRPAYMHLFADHYRAPWYAHYALSCEGAREALQPPAEQMLKSGQATPWCNLTPTVYQDSGAALNLSVRYTYWEKAACLRAKIEFGRSASAADQNVQVIKMFDVDATPNGVVIIAPPELESKECLARLKRDGDFADEIGRKADAFAWPTYGKRPVKIPFLVAATAIEGLVDASVANREKKTLDYFGFNGAHDRVLGGLWQMRENSYCRPDLDEMRKRVRREADEFRKAGRKVEDLALCMLTDEPTGQPASFAAGDEAYRDKFRGWLRKQGLAPADLLVANWEEVRPIAEAARAEQPALHYFTQLFRTRALGDFMAAQRRIIEGEYGRSLPTLVNFSDGAVYHGNFCGQGVDYFELLDADDQNAIWGEDWANNSSTFQCASFNVDLMRAAARRRGQAIGHYLIAYAGRTAWDTKTKATSETARGVRVWMNFCYGPNWSSHEGGPAWRSTLWNARPEVWTANAEITREIGAVEDWLLTAKPAVAETALLYSSSSDIWTHWSNLAFGFDRMHTWLALAHAQVPVDIVPEREAATGQLDKYKACYLSGPNLTRAAAAKLRVWVEAGGTLWLTAGAASRDEFDRPLDALADLLPAEPGELATLEPYQSSGRFLNYLTSRDEVHWGDETLEVLSVKQALTPRAGGKVLATFNDGTPAVVGGDAGKGRIMAVGFLPALAYIKPALAARLPLDQQAAKERLANEKLAALRAASANADQPEATNAAAAKVDDNRSSTATSLEVAYREMLDRSYNPWQFPAGIRELMVAPTGDLRLAKSLSCDVPLVDAVALPCQQGTLVALANYTIRPLEGVNFELRAGHPVARIESVRHGSLQFEQPSLGVVRWTMPLEANDFVKVWAAP